MDFMTLTCTAKEIGDVLDITDRRVRQLAEEGVFERETRGKYRLRDCVLAYIASIETDESDELRRERIALMKAQRRRIELDNSVREGAETDLSFQDTIIAAVSIWWFLHIRPIATWLFEDLRRRGVKDDTIIAGEVQGWLIALRAEGEENLKAAAAKARRQGVIIGGYDDLARLIGGESNTSDDSPDESEPPSRRKKRGEPKP